MNRRQKLYTFVYKETTTSTTTLSFATSAIDD